MKSALKTVIACFVSLVVGAAGMYIYFTNFKQESKTEQPELVTRVDDSSGKIQWKYKNENDAQWRDLISISELMPKEEEYEFRTNPENGKIQYRNEAGEWIDLVEVKTLTGSEG